MTPWEKQATILTALRDNRRVAVRAGQGVGKSFAAAIVALWFWASFPPAKVAVTAPSYDQLHRVLMPEIRRLHANARMPLGGQMIQTILRAPADDWWLWGFTTNEAERFQGIHGPHVLTIFDEAPGIDRRIWEAAEGGMANEDARFLAIGNPTAPSGPFYDAFAGGVWHGERISCLEHPNVAEGREVIPGSVTRLWVEERRREWGEDSPLYAARVMGEFPENASDSLVPLSWLQYDPETGGDAANAVARGIRALPRILGVDVARYGSDESVVAVRDQERLLEVSGWRNLDTMETAGRVIAMAREWKVEPQGVYVDEIGVGSGVVDRLREQGFYAKGVNFGAGASDKQYANTRAECYWRMREALAPDAKRRLCVPARFAEARSELVSIGYGFTSGGAIKIEEKDAVKKRIGRSPDHADALALTFSGSGHSMWVV